MEWNYYTKCLPFFFVILVATIFLCYNEDLTSTQILFSTENLPSRSNYFYSWRQRDDLQIALEKASTNKTVIIAVINEAYVEPCDGEYPSMFDLFLEGFWVGEGTRPLLGRLLVVSMDRTAHERCQFRRLNCYLLAADGGGFAGEKLYMTGEFIEMMWRRTAFLLDVLRRGYNFIFTDSDVIWLRNPFARLNQDSFDMQISTDKFNGNSLSEKNPINTGFYMIRSNKKTTSLFQKWYDMRSNSEGMKEQDVLQKLIQDRPAFSKFKVRTRFLDTQYFSGFCSDADTHNFGSVVTVHANCCRTIKAKIIDLKKVLMDWKKIKGDGYGNRNASLRWSAHTACANSWASNGLL